MRIVVLGGAGKMGCIAVQDLSGDRRVDEVVIADRDLAQARTVAEIINSPEVSIQQVDVTDHDALVGTLEGADACLNATVYYFNLQVMDACLEAGVPYTDLGGLFHTTRKQLELSDRFAEAGLSAVLGMGSAPGVPTSRPATPPTGWILSNTSASTMASSRPRRTTPLHHMYVAASSPTLSPPS